jgi:hypothetical protein
MTGGDMREPRKERVRCGGSAPNGLEPVPGSLGGVREDLREIGKWRSGSGGSEFQTQTDRQTHTHTARRDNTKRTWEEGEDKWESLSHVIQQATP